MLLKNVISAISLLALVWSGSAQTTPEPNIIPRPNVASYPQGILPQPKRITYRHSVRHAHSIVTYMRGALTLPQTTPVLRLEGAKAKSAWLHFVREPQGTKPAGWYRLSVSSEGVRIAATSMVSATLSRHYVSYTTLRQVAIAMPTSSMPHATLTAV